MSINFDKIELEEKSAEALKHLQGDEAFMKYVSDAVSNREEAVRLAEQNEAKKYKTKADEFRTTNVQLKEQLEKFNGFDADEYKRLKSLGSDVNAANEQMKRMELEWQGRFDGVVAERDEAKNENMALKKQVDEDAFKFDAQLAISRHNAKYKAVAVQEGGAATDLIEKMMKSRKVIDNRVVMLDNEKEFTTDSGIGSLDDWINTVGRRDFPYLFNQPAGGGATGSTSSGAGSKQITRSEFDAISDPVRKSEIARTHTITD